MVSPDDAVTDQFRDFIDAKAALIAGACIAVLTLSLEYGAGIEVPFVYRLSPLILHFAYVFSRDAALSARTWVVPIAIITLGTFGFSVF